MLANEQVIDGHCERCGAEVTKRELTQWYFKITDYAQELLDNLDALEPTWPDRVITAQRNWIGRSEGAHVNFEVDGGEPLTVYTTRPDTLFGATFMVVAADAKLAGDLVTDEQRPAYEAYLEEVRKASDIDGCRPTGRSPVSSWALRRFQPGQRAADPDLGVGLRAGRLRHRGDHGRARAGPARLGLRREVRPRPSSARCSRAPASRRTAARLSPGQGPAINSANDEISLDGLEIAAAKTAPSSTGWRRRAPARAR